jgi:hypothetical protein
MDVAASTFRADLVYAAAALAVWKLPGMVAVEALELSHQNILSPIHLRQGYIFAWLEIK